MEIQQLLNWIGGIATVCLSGYVTFVHARMEQLKKDNEKTAKELSEFKLDVAKNHPTDSDMRDIREALIRIEAKLDRKVDK